MRLFPLSTAVFLSQRSALSAADRERDQTETHVPKRTIALPILAVVCTAVLMLFAAIAGTGDSPQPRLSLAVHPSGRTLRVQWCEFGGTGRIESALLTVREGHDELSVDLLDRYKSTGEIIVHSRGREVVVSLRVRRQGQSSVAQTVTYVEPRVAKTPGPQNGVSPDV